MSNDAAPMRAALVTQNPIEPSSVRAPRPAPASKTARVEQVALPRKQQQADAGEAIQIRQTTVDSHVNPALGKAYQLFMNGDLTAAQQQYQVALQQEPNNRDALLGMAAISIARKKDAEAGAFYVRLLELDPADPDAIGGLIGLQGGDPSEMESRLKKALMQSPQSGALMFALGNLYSRQSRWSDAQQAYFRAFGTVPDNPDYAFNLAVSLDRLNQETLALEYYQRALAIAQTRPGNFNKVAIQDRIKQLQSSPGS
jgi:tetratricopeptide (TPR) repeat protein